MDIAIRIVIGDAMEILEKEVVGVLPDPFLSRLRWTTSGRVYMGRTFLLMGVRNSAFCPGRLLSREEPPRLLPVFTIPQPPPQLQGKMNMRSCLSSLHGVLSIPSRSPRPLWPSPRSPECPGFDGRPARSSLASLRTFCTSTNLLPMIGPLSPHPGRPL